MNDYETKSVPLKACALVPASAPPSMQDLSVRVATRRRRRTMIRCGLGCTVVAASLCLIFVLWPTENQIAAPNVASNDNSIVVAPSTDILPKDSAVEAESESTAPKLRLLARVRGCVPIFHLQRDTKQISVVGWVEAEESIPVDMRYVPSQQQETFNAVLNGTADPINL